MRVTDRFPGYARLVALSLMLALQVAPSSRSIAQQEFLSAFGSPDIGSIDQAFGYSAAPGYFDDDEDIDLVVGAPHYGDPSGGRVYVLFGPLDGFDPESNLGHLQVAAFSSYFKGWSIAYAPTFRSPHPEGVLPGMPLFAAGAKGSNGGQVLTAYSDTSLHTVVLPRSLDQINKLDYGDVVASGDFNGDSFDDLIVRTGQSSGSPPSQVLVYLGGVGADDQFDIIIEPAVASSSFGKVLCGVDDVTGDGYDDLLIGDANADRVYLVFGREAAQGGPQSIIIPGVPQEDDGICTVSYSRVHGATGGVDLTGNGHRDIVLAEGHLNDGSVSVFEGPFVESSFPAAHTTLHGSSSFGTSFGVGGDVDGDGESDLLIGARTHTPYGTNTGRVTVVLGGDRLVSGSISCNDVLTERNVWQLQPAGLGASAEFGRVVGFLGDLDDDGKDEIFVGAPGVKNAAEDRLGKVYGYNLSVSDIAIAESAAPVQAGPACAPPQVLAVQVDSPHAVDVFADATSIGGASSIELFDDGIDADEVNGDGVYSAYLGGIVGGGSGIIEIFARGDSVSGGFAIRDIGIEIAESDLVAPYAEFPLPRGAASSPLLAIRIMECGGVPPNAVYLTPSGPFYWSVLQLNDSGLNGDELASDGIWSYRGSSASQVIPNVGFYDFSLLAIYPGDGNVVSNHVKFQVIDPVATSYVNRSSYTGLDYEGQPYSCVAIDFDRIGPADLFVSILDANAVLYRSVAISSAGTPLYYEASPGDTGGLPPADLLGLAVADFNNDGFQDLFAASQAHATLYEAEEQAGGPVLVNKVGVAVASSVLQNSITGAWADYDRDGMLDLFVGRGEVTIGEPGFVSGVPMSGVLLHNNIVQTGVFDDVSVAAGISTGGAAYCVTATWGDFNNDRFPDLFVGDASASGAQCRLFRNITDGTFIDEAASRIGPGGINEVVAATFADMDNDTDLDLLLTTKDAVSVRINANGGSFSQSVAAGSGNGFSGSRTIDYDSDGVLDILASVGGEFDSPRLYRNSLVGGLPTFVNVASSAGLGWGGKIGGCVVADFNNDGDLDVYLGRPVVGGAYFFTASGVDPVLDEYLANWVGVDLSSNIGVPNNSMGIGAVITVKQGLQQFVRSVDGGSGRGGQDYDGLVFGLPTSSPVSEIVVDWPNSYRQVVTGVSLGNTVTIEDNTQGFGISRTFGSYEIVPCSVSSRWIITWVTSCGTNPSLDGIVYKIGDANLEIGATTVPATDGSVQHKMYAKAVGTYQHEMQIFPAPCALQQTVYFAAISEAAPGTQLIGDIGSFTPTVCGSECDPPQE